MHIVQLAVRWLHRLRCRPERDVLRVVGRQPVNGDGDEYLETGRSEMIRRLGRSPVCGWLCLMILFSCETGCGRLAFDYAANPDGAIHNDSPPADAPPPTPAFVQNFERQCTAVQSCTVATPGMRTGNLLLVTITYNPTTLDVLSVEDDLGRSFTRVIDPVDWSPLQGNYHSELWWARNQGASSVTVTLNGTVTSLLDVYVDEFVATAIDQTAAATGEALSATTVSSGTRSVTAVPALIFGHGEGQGPTVFPAVGFTLLSTLNSNVEETKPISSPGTYDAQFVLSGPGDWVALMVTLR